MAELNLKVKCFRCRQERDKSEVRPLHSISQESRYECYRCTEKSTREPILAGVEKPLPKSSYICVRCNYKFNSKVKVCPCCSKGDMLAKGTISVKDLI